MTKLDKPKFHHLHVRLDMILWRELRELFPDYGDIRRVINKAVEQFIRRWKVEHAHERRDRIL